MGNPVVASLIEFVYGASTVEFAIGSTVTGWDNSGGNLAIPGSATPIPTIAPTPTPTATPTATPVPKFVSMADGPEIASYSVSSMGCTRIQDVAFDGTNLWMLCGGGLDQINHREASLFKLNPTTAEKLAEYSISTYEEPYIMNYGGGRLWITSVNGVFRIFNIGTESIENQPSPGGVIYNAIFDGENVWALHANSPGIIVTTAGFTLNSICGSWCGELVSDGNYVYIADYAGGTPKLYKLRKSDGAVLETYTSGDFEVGAGISDLMYDGTRIWTGGLATDGTYYWTAGGTTLIKRTLE